MTNKLHLSLAMLMLRLSQLGCFGLMGAIRSDGLLKSEAHHKILAKNFELFQSTNMMASPEWYTLNDCLVLFPLTEKVPKSIVHFIGGFVAGSAVNIAYGDLLEHLSLNGHLVIATPIPALDLDHQKVANDAGKSFRVCYLNSISPILGTIAKDIPIIGLSHSLGGKLTGLLDSGRNDYISDIGKKGDISSQRDKAPLMRNKDLFAGSPVANIFLAFNNYGIQENIEMAKSQISEMAPELRQIMSVIYTPEFEALLKMATKTSVGDLLKDLKIDKSLKNSAASAVSAVTGALDGFLGSKNRLLTDTLTEELTSRFNEAAERLDKSIEDLPTMSSFQFKPSPDETWQRLQSEYPIRQNVIVKFEDDQIDESLRLFSCLRERGCDVKFLEVEGDHVTPNIPTRDGKMFLSLLSRELERIVLQYEDGSLDVSPLPIRYPSRNGERRFFIGDGSSRKDDRDRIGWDSDNY